MRGLITIKVELMLHIMERLSIISATWFFCSKKDINVPRFLYFIYLHCIYLFLQLIFAFFMKKWKIRFGCVASNLRHCKVYQNIFSALIASLFPTWIRKHFIVYIFLSTNYFYINRNLSLTSSWSFRSVRDF